jgi:hypothetical protein
MDADRIATRTRALTRASSRRTLVNSAFGAALTAALESAPIAAKKGKRRLTCRTIRCPECAPYQRGPCRPKPDGTPCTSMNGQCLAGQCVLPTAMTTVSEEA